jgi:hypothetical protein
MSAVAGALGVLVAPALRRSLPEASGRRCLFAFFVSFPPSREEATLADFEGVAVGDALGVPVGVVEVEGEGLLEEVADGLGVLLGDVLGDRVGDWLGDGLAFGALGTAMPGAAGELAPRSCCQTQATEPPAGTVRAPAPLVA